MAECKYCQTVLNSAHAHDPVATVQMLSVMEWLLPPDHEHALNLELFDSVYTQPLFCLLYTSDAADE